MGLAVSWLDVVLVLLFVGSTAMGFWQRFVRQLLLFVAGYTGTAVAAQFYPALASLFLSISPETGAGVASLLAFCLLAMAFTVIVMALAWAAYRETRLPMGFMLDNFLGTVFGAIIGVFAGLLVIELARYGLETAWTGSSTKQLLTIGLHDSFVQNSFLLAQPLSFDLLGPWFPLGVPSILSR